MNDGRPIRRKVPRENATLERLVTTQLGALEDALRGALARAGLSVEQTVAAFEAEVALALRLARSAEKLLTAFACLNGGTHHSLIVRHIGPDGRLLKQKTRTWIQERTIRLPSPAALRQRKGGGAPSLENEVRMARPDSRHRGGQPGNANRLAHGRWSHATIEHRDEVRNLIRQTDCLILRLAMVQRMRITSPLWGGRRAQRAGWGAVLPSAPHPKCSRATRCFAFRPPHKEEVVAPLRSRRPVPTYSRRRGAREGPCLTLWTRPRLPHSQGRDVGLRGRNGH